MTEETTKLVRELADKLGTTTEHLWSTLVRQAPISSTCDILIVCTAAVWITATLWNLKRIGAWLDDADDDVLGLSVTAAMVITNLIAVCIVFYGLVNLGTILSGFFNPEYWALKQILK